MTRRELRYQTPRSLINLAVDISQGCYRRCPPYIPPLIPSTEFSGGRGRELVNISNYVSGMAD
ncbi:hypothetical protein G7B40_007495 [Aetokthonos hydrillicola Thurmond2011]|jgi:hypothetical protein|uniref:Uncharacterized protein n=1 Tax=Aetokthonos hydrillicola Thurmond2011 TaxID=2712845 RepID=A0AAP5I4A9_9CYAN|nr:hypothetical protein [Aetokthonos hydrillicola CCALA 1050]MDR9894415.1 hypothetical protein [Aetokthonos hydrillicola Thurmond2011]